MSWDKKCKKFNLKKKIEYNPLELELTLCYVTVYNMFAHRNFFFFHCVCVCVWNINIRGEVSTV